MQASTRIEQGDWGGAKAFGGVLAFPFLFYGHRPLDWADGIMMGHAYEIRFRNEPDARTRAWIARIFETAVHGTTVAPPDATRPFQWSGTWALVCIGERRTWGAAIDSDCFFEDMEKVFLALHEVSPIAEVVMGNVRRKGTGEWDAWSHAQQRMPTPHPPFPSYQRIYALEDVDYVEDRIADGAPSHIDATIDATFEAMRLKVRNELDLQSALNFADEARDRPTRIVIAPAE